MPEIFISESIRPVKGTFDPLAMSRGEPGLPSHFHWREGEFEILKILESWKGYGDCTHGSGERYVRKHYWRVLTADGRVLTLYFQRHFGRSRQSRVRWRLQSEATP